MTHSSTVTTTLVQFETDGLATAATYKMAANNDFSSDRYRLLLLFDHRRTLPSLSSVVR